MMKGDEEGARWKHHMLCGEFESAWRISDRIMRDRAKSDGGRGLQEPCLWRGEPLEDKRVIISCRHGLGDTIQFIRYVPLVQRRTRKVIVQAQPELIELLGKIGGINQLITPDASANPAYDVAVEVMELPHVFRTRVQTVPADCPYFQVKARLRVDAGSFHIGLIWKSGDWDDRRSIPCSLMAPLGELPGVTLHILQRGTGLQERPAGFGVSSGTDDIVELAEIMRGLDLVISVDSMPAHLAGALAVPTWTLLHADCDWRWMKDKSNSPWYPTMRLFRQKRLGHWEPVVQEVTEELKQLVRQRQHWTGVAAAA